MNARSENVSRRDKIISTRRRALAAGRWKWDDATVGDNVGRLLSLSRRSRRETLAMSGQIRIIGAAHFASATFPHSTHFKVFFDSTRERGED
jgi:hypothetical protein